MFNNCRICLKTHAEMCSIYTYKNKEYLPLLIYNISGVKVSEKLEPEAQICTRCTTALLIAQKVILRCQEAQEYLAYMRLRGEQTQSQESNLEFTNAAAAEEVEPAATPMDMEHTPTKAEMLYSDDETATQLETLDSNDAPDHEQHEQGTEMPEKRINNVFHKKAALFQCDQCDYSNNVGKRLVEHKQTAHNIYDPNIYKCTLCPQRFSWKPTLYRHIQLVHKTLPADKKYLCNECGRAYTRKVHLSEHTKQRHGPRNFKCPDPDCEQTFGRAFTLRRHYLAAHTEPTLTRYHCAECDKYFKIYDLWKYHNEVIHKNEIVYCPHCGYAFRFKEKLSEHLLKNTCKRSIVPCAYCQRRFTTKVGLKDHMRNLHRLY